MTNRRTFIKTLAAGTAALGTPVALFSTTKDKELRSIATGAKCDYDESQNLLTIVLGGIQIKGKVGFTALEYDWMLVPSRDGVENRMALVDKKGNVKAYLRPVIGDNKVELLFFHRSAQNFTGKMTFEGSVSLQGDTFSCKTQAAADEKVFNLAAGNAFSLQDDSIFSVDTDTLLQFTAAERVITPREKGKYAICLQGRIEKAAEAVFGFELKNHYFASRWVPYYKPLRKKGMHKVPTGWMSWNTYFDKATAEDNLSEARIGKKYLQPFGCEIWHIESWQGNSDKLPVSDFYNMNLEVNEKQFPKGMKKLADDIRSLGFTPGIWMAPFGTGNKEFYLLHKDWFLHDEKGNPIACWNGKYTLDPTVDEALEHIEKIFHTASADWGYEYFKVDGMSGRNHGYCAHLYERPEIKARFRNPACKNPFERVVKAIRRGIGEEKYMLACQGHATGPESVYANASRLGADIVSPNQPVKWEGVRNQAFCFMNQAFTHNIVMICDPDTLLVRDLPMEQARVSATVIALGGQLTFFGDKLKGLPIEKMKILQQTLPVANVRPKSLYPCFDMLEKWNLLINNGIMAPYNTVALFNWEDEEKTISTSCAELGIPQGDYEGWEFWTERYVCLSKDGTLSIQVPAHGVRVITLHKREDKPQWLASDRHICSHAVEVSAYAWQGNTLRLKVHVVGGFPLSMTFSTPAPYQLKSVYCQGAKHAEKYLEGTVQITLQSAKGIDTELLLEF